MKEEQTGAAVPDQSPRSVSESDTEGEMIQEALDGFDAYVVSEAQQTQDVIIVHTDVDPELNPSSPDFNPEKYREELSRLDLPAIEARLKAAVKNIINRSAAQHRFVFYIVFRLFLGFVAADYRAGYTAAVFQEGIDADCSHLPVKDVARGYIVRVPYNVVTAA